MAEFFRQQMDERALPNSFLEAYQGKVWPVGILQSIVGFVAGTAELDDIEKQKFRHSLLITGLTYTLAHRIEPPLSSLETSVPEEARSFAKWVRSVLQTSIDAESAKSGNVRFSFKCSELDDGGDAIFPAGTLCLTLQELVRNASKHGAPDSVRKVTLKTKSHDVLSVTIQNEKHDGLVADTTGAGRQSLKSALSVNFGPAGFGGWKLTVCESDARYSVKLDLNIARYRHLIKQAYENRNS
jgi:hypothetical protein